MMEDNWVVFPSDLENQFALFSVNAGYRGEAPLESHGVCQWIVADWEDGFPKAEVLEELETFEDWLVGFVESKMGAYVGRITSVAGQRHFFFYTPKTIVDSVNEALVEYGASFDVSVDGRDDSDWEIYSEFLYPTPFDWQRISNQSVLRSLEEHGDVHEIPRIVDHYAFFETTTSRDAYQEFVQGLGYEVIGTHDEKGSFHIHFTKETAVTLDMIDDVVLALFVKATEFGGTYDGWGCPVMKIENADG